MGARFNLATLSEDGLINLLAMDGDFCGGLNSDSTFFATYVNNRDFDVVADID